jgi:DinB superfamily
MIEHVADELDAIVDEASIWLRDVPEALAATKLSPRRWSVKEIFGHLVDSVANNHQRFVRAQQSGGGEFAFPGYEQDDWVRLQAYQERPWQELVELWALYNRHLAHAIRRIPESSLSVSCRIGTNEPVTLRFLVEDYVVHLRHHLQQIRERGAA